MIVQSDKPAGQQFWLLWAIPLTLLGLGLRLLGARGDLWLDEVHSLNLVSGLHTPDEVFWNINHDNNHFLTSLYLFFVGPHHSSLVLRLESIVLGTLSIPAAGLAAMRQERRDVTAAFLAMLSCAVVYPSVHYGSEARGYAGLVLFSFLAIHRAEKGIATVRQQAVFGLVVLLGLLSHLLMLFVAIGLFLRQWALVRQPGEDIFAAMFGVAAKFWAVALAGAAVAGCILFGSSHHSFIRGAEDPSTLPQLLAAIDRFYDLVLGLPGIPGFYPGLVAALLVLALYAGGLAKADKPRALLYALFLFLYPAWMMVSGGNDLHQPRYCMPLLAPLLLLLAECGSLAMRRGRAARILAIMAIAAILTGNACELDRFLTTGRGHYADAVAAMTRDGPVTYGSDALYGHSQMVDYYADRLGVTATFIPFKDWCVMPPGWLIHSDFEDSHPAEIHLGPAGCKLDFAIAGIYPRWGLSGWAWTLYRRVETGQDKRE